MIEDYEGKLIVTKKGRAQIHCLYTYNFDLMPSLIHMFQLNTFTLCLYVNNNGLSLEEKIG